jgi:hypothetical protein
MPEAALRSSSDLRAELSALDLDLGALDGRLSSCDARIRGLALLARRGDAASVKQIAEAKSLKVSIATEIDFTSAARVQLNEELAQALEREATEARKKISDEALAFAQLVEPLGAVLDEHLTKFRDGFVDLKKRLHDAELRGYGAGGAVVQSALTQAMRAALWRITELSIPPPEGGLGRSFGWLTTSWSGAARGAAKRLLAPPATPPKPNGANGAAHPASSGPVVERLIPKRADLSEPMAGDDPSFKVHADRAAADRAIAAAAAGPGRKP